MAFTKFQALVAVARQRAPRLFEAPVLEGCHLGVEALVQLARFQRSHIRPVSEWAGTAASWRLAVASLAHHLLCNYRVPFFLASAWWARDVSADRKRGWFVAHAAGARFRSLDLPMTMTRRMEDLFLASPDHLPIEAALRRAELLGLGSSAEITQAVLATQLGSDLRHSEFWRTVWMFLIANAADLDAMQIGPLIDFLQAVQQEAAEDGMVEFGSQRRTFCMKGRTVQSMLRAMREWHRSLGQGGISLSWTGAPFAPLLYVEPSREDSETPRRWQMMELVNSAQLRREGAALHHCVASYADRCRRGVSSIWSLRFWQAEKIHHVLTVEVDPRRRAVVQARGRANRVAAGRPLRLLQDWAGRERLQMMI